MRSLLFTITFLFIACARLSATEALVFDGGGYALHILIGEKDGPAVAQVRLMAPGAKDWVGLPHEQLKIEKFDWDQRILAMRFTNKDDPALPSSFSFSAKKNHAVLSIDGKQIKSSFDWDI